jgi:hypothetical protein
MHNLLTTLAYAAALSIAGLATTAAADAATLKVENLGNEPIALVYISPTWVPNFRDIDQQLDGNEYIDADEMTTFEFQGNGDCYFDLRAVFLDGATIDNDNANLCAADVWTVSN